MTAALVIAALAVTFSAAFALALLNGRRVRDKAARAEEAEQRLADGIKAADGLQVPHGIVKIAGKLDATSAEKFRAGIRQAIIDSLHPPADWPVDGDEPLCENCVIAWDNDADRCGIIPCPEHKPKGRHHATAPEYGGVIVATVTDLASKRRAR